MFVKISETKVMQFDKVDSIFVEENEKSYDLIIEKEDGAKEIILSRKRNVQDIYLDYLERSRVYLTFNIILAQLKYENIFNANIDDLIESILCSKDDFSDALDNVADEMSSFVTDEKVKKEALKQTVENNVNDVQIDLCEALEE